MALQPITVESVDRFTGLVIGPAGIGKTSLLRTIPDDEKACVLSAESGLLCVRDLVLAKKVEGFEIENFSDMREAYVLLNTDREAQKRYSWIFVDSLSEISARCSAAMKEKYPRKEDSFNLWGEYTDLMIGMIKSFRDIRGYNVIFTCLPAVDKDENNRRYIAPNVAGKQVKQLLTSFFDEVFYFEAMEDDDNNPYRAFVTAPWERYPAKDRSGKLSLIEKPDLSYIKNKIFTTHEKGE